jgi:hypothetical protein
LTQMSLIHRRILPMLDLALHSINIDIKLPGEEAESKNF